MSSSESSTLCQLTVAASKARVVDLPQVKPHCWAERGWICSKWSTSRFLICFSRRLLNTERSEIGWDWTCCVILEWWKIVVVDEGDFLKIGLVQTRTSNIFSLFRRWWKGAFSWTEWSYSSFVFEGEGFVPQDDQILFGISSFHHVQHPDSGSKHYIQKLRESMREMHIFMVVTRKLTSKLWFQWQLLIKLLPWKLCFSTINV